MICKLSLQIKVCSCACRMKNVSYDVKLASIGDFSLRGQEEKAEASVFINFSGGTCHFLSKLKGYVCVNISQNVVQKLFIFTEPSYSGIFGKTMFQLLVKISPLPKFRALYFKVRIHQILVHLTFCTLTP